MKSLFLVNPNGSQVFDLSEVIPHIELILKEKLKWYLISFFGIINERKLGLKLSKLYGINRRELGDDILSKFDFGPYCEFHEGFVAGFKKEHSFKTNYSTDKLFKVSTVVIGYDHLNTGAITSHLDFLIDDLALKLTKLDRYPSSVDSFGNQIEFPMLPAEGVEDTE